MTDTEIVDLHLADEDEICAVIDDACDHGKTVVFTDSLTDAEKPLAVLLPYAEYERMARMSTGVKTSKFVKDWLGKAATQ